MHMKHLEWCLTRIIILIIKFMKSRFPLSSSKLPGNSVMRKWATCIIKRWQTLPLYLWRTREAADIDHLLGTRHCIYYPPFSSFSLKNVSITDVGPFPLYGRRNNLKKVKKISQFPKASIWYSQGQKTRSVSQVLAFVLSWLKGMDTN